MKHAHNCNCHDCIDKMLIELHKDDMEYKLAKEACEDAKSIHNVIQIKEYRDRNGV